MTLSFAVLTPPAVHRPAPDRHVEFHVSRAARDRYGFSDLLFAASGRAVFADFRAARLFALTMQEAGHTDIQAGDINAMGLIDELLHQAIDRYRQGVNPTVMADALTWIQTQLGAETVQATLLAFTEAFPPVKVYRGHESVEDYLSGSTNGVPNRELVLEELLVLWLANENPAFAPFQELFDDTALRGQSRYAELVSALQTFLANAPPIYAEATKPAEEPSATPPTPVSLIDLLLRPAREAPHSLVDQLNYMQGTWGFHLTPDWSDRIIKGTGFIKEEEQTREIAFFNWQHQQAQDEHWGGHGPIEAPAYTPEVEDEPELYSEDLDWMPNVVMIAKSTLVWLDQLSKTYEQPITRLDEIPDEELDQLAKWGFTALWLIGLWERSPASRAIKRRMGNPEAEPSAYSLIDYTIADALGGYEAYENLRDRCKDRGLRLASDMVPNHTGMDSTWVREHPEWFVHLRYPPYPNYRFSGPNLSSDPDYGIYLEDSYYNRSDASVVFRRTELRTGKTHYIYHGNDGTGLPWNDTAQLDYLKPVVREAVIQTILEVARMFPIIRFDAAMVLVKRHIRRLWYPAPNGPGDCVSSRTEFSLSKELFDQLMPEEFWREVVDRVAEEAPDTLLLAEAFWMLEGYFVRTLGMHRVYNSAFMHMLRDEDNAKYRETIKNTIAFDPEILKRYVNFMNNPDEDTAIEQFGKGDKYFGICMMMLTMPGLPMFGHGQVQGFKEKYGMEYARAYLDETPDTHLIERHERELFPLMKKRHLFADVEQFFLYDFEEGARINENVFAYSNRAGDDRVLVFYNNAFQPANGWIRTSAPYAVKGEGEEKTLEEKTLGEGLALTDATHHYVICREQVDGLEYIYPSAVLCKKGFHLHLNGYDHRVYMDFREVVDDATGTYAQLTAQLHGRGVPSIDEARRGHLLRGLHTAVSHALKQVLRETDVHPLEKEPLLTQALIGFFDEVAAQTGDERSAEDQQALAQETIDRLNTFLHLPNLATAFPWPRAKRYAEATRQIAAVYGEDPAAARVACTAAIILRSLDRFTLEDEEPEETIIADPVQLFDLFNLHQVLQQTFESVGFTGGAAHEATALVRALVAEGPAVEDLNPRRALKRVLETPVWTHFLKVNTFDDVVWFNKERFALMCNGLLLARTAHATGLLDAKPKGVAQTIVKHVDVIAAWQRAEAASAYRVADLRAALKPARKPRTKRKTKSQTSIKKTKR